jgi:Mn-containing catalase
VIETKGMMDHKPTGTSMTMDEAKQKTKEVSQMRSEEIKKAVPKGDNQWSKYPEMRKKQHT